jgi:hypothetical protein
VVVVHVRVVVADNRSGGTGRRLEGPARERPVDDLHAGERVVSKETRTRWMVAITAAVVVAVRPTVVVMALVMHPAITLEPGL